MHPDEIAKLVYRPPPQLHTRVVNKVDATVEALENLYPHKPKLVVPTIKYDLRGRTGGQARSDNVIRINTAALTDDRYTEHYLQQTIPHEVAHIAMYQWYPDDYIGHGPIWQIAMVKLGLPPNRCHSYQLTPAKKHQRKFVYTCDCANPKRFTTNRHNRAQKGTRYHCTICNTPLIYSHTED